MGEQATEFRHETERLILRDWREEDWGSFWRHCNTPSVMRWLGGVASEAEITAASGRVEGYRREHGYTFWVCERKVDSGHLSGEMLGFCGLKRSNQAPGPIGMMEVGWRLREDAWGRGYAKEAAVASLDLAFGRFGADEVIAITVPGNTASWGLMKRLGMTPKPELDFPSNDFDPEGGLSIVYSIERNAWTKNGG